MTRESQSQGFCKPWGTGNYSVDGVVGKHGRGRRSGGEQWPFGVELMVLYNAGQMAAYFKAYIHAACFARRRQWLLLSILTGGSREQRSRHNASPADPHCSRRTSRRRAPRARRSCCSSARSVRTRRSGAVRRDTQRREQVSSIE
jgi:hypothetical protein